MKYKVSLYQVARRTTEVEITAEDEDQAINLAEEKVSKMSEEEINKCSIDGGFVWDFEDDGHEVEEAKEEVEEEVNAPILGCSEKGITHN